MSFNLQLFPEVAITFLPSLQFEDISLLPVKYSLFYNLNIYSS